MTRQEQIEKAATDYCRENDDNLVYGERDAFIAGAMWSDNSVLKQASKFDLSSSKTIAQHAESACMDYRTLHNRLTRSGLPIEKALSAPPYNPKAVLCFDKDGTLLGEYPSSKVACACCGGALSGRGHIDDVCRGQRKTALGFIWKYKEQ